MGENFLASKRTLRHDIVIYLGFTWQIKQVLDLMIKFVQLATIVHKSFSNKLLFSFDFQLNSVALLQFWSELQLTVSSFNSSARTSRKTPSCIVKNACLLPRYISKGVLLSRTHASGMCLQSLNWAVEPKGAKFPYLMLHLYAYYRTYGRSNDTRKILIQESYLL
jgi:hypothetical protein